MLLWEKLSSVRSIFKLVQPPIVLGVSVENLFQTMSNLIRFFKLPISVGNEFVRIGNILLIV